MYHYGPCREQEKDEVYSTGCGLVGEQAPDDSNKAWLYDLCQIGARRYDALLKD